MPSWHVQRGVEALYLNKNRKLRNCGRMNDDSYDQLVDTNMKVVTFLGLKKKVYSILE